MEKGVVLLKLNNVNNMIGQSAGPYCNEALSNPAGLLHGLLPAGALCVSSRPDRLR